MNKYQLLLVALLFFGCSDNTNFITISAYDKQVIEYFPRVALGFENSTIEPITRKWEEEIKIFVYGDVSSTNLLEIEKVKDEINQLATDGFQISIVQDSIQANFYLFLGSAEEYSKRIPFFTELVDGFTSYFYLYWNSNNQLRLSFSFVDITQLDAHEEAFYLRSVITRSLGFGRYPYMYYESIFSNDPGNGVDGYAPIDRDLIRLMYHLNMQIGLTEGDSLKNLLLTILLNEK